MQLSVYVLGREVATLEQSHGPLATPLEDLIRTTGVDTLPPETNFSERFQQLYAAFQAAQGTRPGVQRHVSHRAQRGEDAGPAVVGDQPGQVDHHPLRPGRQRLGQRAPHPHRGGVRVDAGRLLVAVDVVVVDVAVGGAGVAHDGRRVAQRGQRERQVGPAGRDRPDRHLRARTGGDEGTTERGPRVG